MDLQRRAIIYLRNSNRGQNDDRDAQAQTEMTMFRSCNLRLRLLHEPRHNLLFCPFLPSDALSSHDLDKYPVEKSLMKGNSIRDGGFLPYCR
jgi:hypothetical protein